VQKIYFIKNSFIARENERVSYAFSRLFEHAFPSFMIIAQFAPIAEGKLKEIIS